MDDGYFHRTIVASDKITGSPGGMDAKGAATMDVSMGESIHYDTDEACLNLESERADVAHLLISSP